MVTNSYRMVTKSRKHDYQILLIKSFNKKCSDCKSFLRYEEINRKFLVYNCLNCKNYYEIKFDEKLMDKFNNTFKVFVRKF